MKLRLGIIALIITFLAWYAIAFGAPVARPVCQDPGCVELSSEFPFKSMDDPALNAWHMAGGPQHGMCVAGPIAQGRLLNEDESVGWQFFFNSSNKMVAVRYHFVAPGHGIPNLVIFIRVRPDETFEIVREERYDPAKHVGPCQWFDEKET